MPALREGTVVRKEERMAWKKQDQKEEGKQEERGREGYREREAWAKLDSKGRPVNWKRKQRYNSLAFVAGRNQIPLQHDGVMVATSLIRRQGAQL